MKAKEIKLEKITLVGKVIEYELKVRKSGKNIRLTIHPEKGLVVTIPRRVTKAAAEKFIVEKSAWVLKSIAHYKKIKATAPKKHTAKEIAEYKKKALALAASRLAHFNTFYNFPYRNISIRNQKTRWGSCTRERNLNFNYKIALLPQRLSDYIVVHELCHVKEMNHSVRFWNLVAETIPDHLLRRKELRQSNVRL